jgi:hypothetical protein
MPPARKKNLSSPSISPSYTPGAVRSVGTTPPMVDYKRRLDKSYKGPIKKAVPKMPVKTGETDQANKEYQALMEQYKGNLAKQRDAAMGLYKQNKGMLEQDLATTRSSLAKQRGMDLNDIADQAAARGIGRSSGIYQQAGADYETSYAERLKNADKTFNQQINQENQTQNETIGDATNEYTEGATAAAAARKAAAMDAAKQTAAPKAKTLPKAAPKPTPKKSNKFKLVDGGR